MLWCIVIETGFCALQDRNVKNKNFTILRFYLNFYFLLQWFTSILKYSYIHVYSFYFMRFSLWLITCSRPYGRPRTNRHALHVNETNHLQHTKHICSHKNWKDFSLCLSHIQLNAICTNTNWKHMDIKNQSYHITTQHSTLYLIYFWYNHSLYVKSFHFFHVCESE